MEFNVSDYVHSNVFGLGMVTCLRRGGNFPYPVIVTFRKCVESFTSDGSYDRFTVGESNYDIVVIPPIPYECELTSGALLRRFFTVNTPC